MIESLKDYNYPHFSYIKNLRPRPEILLGREMYWTEKRDGSCLGISLTTDDEWLIRSRKREIAANDLKAAFFASEQDSYVKELILHGREFRDDYIVFGEIMTPGKSPARFETHEDYEFAVFDIMQASTGDFLTYPAVYQRCYQSGVPVVELYSKSQHFSMENLMDFRDKMLERCKDMGREGVVAKTWDLVDNLKAVGHNENYIYVKEKLDSIQPDLITDRDIVGTRPILPPLPESEIYTAIVSIKEDLGEDFSNPKIAMPLIVKAVNTESEKHCCEYVKNIFKYYQESL